MKQNELKIGIAQISPVWLDKGGTISKIENYIEDAAKNECELVVFGEGMLPGYPFWVSLTDGAKFNSKVQKELYAYYVENSIQIESDDLQSICQLARKHKISIYLGIIERAKNRGGHSLYCSLVYISVNGVIESIHRKLQPTYEERLVWAQGDGNGLVTHAIKDFCVGGLNCWENWMPLSRTSLYAQGENLHIAVWPGSLYNTFDITQFIAKESRSFVISVSSVLKKSDIPQYIPHYDKVVNKAPEFLANGGSCMCGPDGKWIIPPEIETESLLCATIDFKMVLEERQNFDVSGHYSRPDVTKLVVNQNRQSIIDIETN